MQRAAFYAKKYHLAPWRVLGIDNAFACVTVYGEVILLTLSAAFLPLWLGLDGLWIANPVSQAAVAVPGVIFCAVSDRRRRAKPAPAPQEEPQGEKTR